MWAGPDPQTTLLKVNLRWAEIPERYLQDLLSHGIPETLSNRACESQTLSWPGDPISQLHIVPGPDPAPRFQQRDRGLAGMIHRQSHKRPSSISPSGRNWLLCHQNPVKRPHGKAGRALSLEADDAWSPNDYKPSQHLDSSLPRNPTPEPLCSWPSETARDSKCLAANLGEACYTARINTGANRCLLADMVWRKPRTTHTCSFSPMESIRSDTFNKHSSAPGWSVYKG